MHSQENKTRGAGPNLGGPPGAGGRPGDKAKDFTGSLKKLFKYCGKHAVFMVIAIVLAISSAILSLMGPSKLAEITNLILAGMSDGIDLEAVSSIGILLVIFYGLSLIFGYLQGGIMAVVSQKICKKLRTEMTSKINRLPLAYFDGNPYGDTLSRFVNDIDTIGTSLNQSMSTIFSGVLNFSGALILMLYTNWVMGVSGLLSTLLGFSLIGIIISKSQKYFIQQQGRLGNLNGHVEETYTGHSIVKAYNKEEFVEKHFQEKNEKLYQSAWKAQFLSGMMMPIMNFTGDFAYVVVCVVGALLVINGSISFGIIVAFMLYIRIFTQPLATLGQSLTTLQSAAAASERVFEFLEEQELSQETNHTVNIKNIKGDVSFKNVAFGYKPEKMIITDFSAEIKAGEKVAIVGPTGAGKTTMVNLLMRFYEVSSGVIAIDGIPISSITRESLHNAFSMVLQDTWMFEGSIIENIAYNQDVSEDEIIEACKSVGIHHTIKTMPKGYNTIMSNATLSTGEKQLLTIARAMVKKSELIILDEATSSVDTRTELLIGKAMDKLSQGKTSFIIAHRLSTIKNADVILVMKDGNIIESGSHNELLDKKGFYAELYNSQFEESDIAS
ncbi:ABC transporter ATP-binding protein [Chakrabartyella piscis]|uniref:ABC transporter ATP-binding protein n=1 Tax=Chakrabartyella piscis TaxID=2918914 RepID=UPI0029586CF8|nr:ABC transporter ATP-binding protein [Chakrabartyella piscis]